MTALSRLSNLQHLHLTGVPWPISFSSLTNLKSLSWRKDGLYDRDYLDDIWTITPLPAHLTALLITHENDNESDFASFLSCIARGVSHLTGLQSLALARCCEGDSPTRLPASYSTQLPTDWTPYICPASGIPAVISSLQSVTCNVGSTCTAAPSACTQGRTRAAERSVLVSLQAQDVRHTDISLASAQDSGNATASSAAAETSQRSLGNNGSSSSRHCFAIGRLNYYACSEIAARMHTLGSTLQ